MFQEIYKSAYKKITLQDATKINEAQIEEWMQGYGRNKIRKKDIEKNKKSGSKTKREVGRMLRPVAAVFLTACLVVILGVPAAAKSIPAFYEVLERNAPGLADYLVPIQVTDCSAGIVMNLEAAKIEGNTAEILVSFTDDGTGDYIHGMVDMYDSYNLHSYSGESNMGGCSFMEYNAEEDKAYFQVDLISSDGTFDAERMNFTVGMLLTDCESDVREISMSEVSWECGVKAVSLNGQSGVETEHSALDKLTVPGNSVDPRPGHLVLDIPVKDMSSDTMEITGIAYMDGILRVQLFRGNFKEADRHMNIYMLDKSGNQMYPNMSVMWHDEVAGEEVLVDEFYFVVTPEQLTEYTLWGESEARGNSVKGNWSITFDVN